MSNIVSELESLSLCEQELKTDESISTANSKNSKGLRNRKDAVSRSPTYKTEICRSHRDLGYCEYEEKCQFAHGVEQLRSRKFSPKYKTQPCKNYRKHGNCRFGPRCQFVHDEERITVGDQVWLVSPSEKLVRIETTTAVENPLQESNDVSRGHPEGPQVITLPRDAMHLPNASIGQSAESSEDVNQIPAETHEGREGASVQQEDVQFQTKPLDGFCPQDVYMYTSPLRSVAKYVVSQVFNKVCGVPNSIYALPWRYLPADSVHGGFPQAWYWETRDSPRTSVPLYVLPTTSMAAM